jgi:apolipoprotein N-acyltransferase
MLQLDDRRTALWPLAPAAALVAATLVYGHWRVLDRLPDAVARVALIQGSIDTELKADPNKAQVVHEHYTALTDEAVRRHGPVDLIVWPETMYRDFLYTRDTPAAMPVDWPKTPAEFEEDLDEAIFQSRRGLSIMAGRYQTPLLLGLDRVHFGRQRQFRFNSAAYVSRGGELLGAYDKMHLVPFGEFVPFAGYLPWLQRLTPLPVSLDAGTRPEAFEAADLRFAPSICFESVMAHVIRGKIVTLGRSGREPDVLVNLTNDGWFWGSSELDMHLACGVFRAVENRKPMLIAANTGFSAWIDGDGRIVAQGPRRSASVLLARVGRDPRSSAYIVYGDLPAGLCLMCVTGLAAVAAWQGRKGRAGRPESKFT